jgi:hypothetical protein
MTTLDILVKAGWELIDNYDEGRIYFIHPSTGRVREIYVRRSQLSKEQSLESAARNMFIFLDQEERRKDGNSPAFR